MHSVELGSRAVESLRACPADIREEVLAALEGLSSVPQPPSCRKLSGRFAGAWRIRVRSYRVLYDVHDERRMVHVLKIGPRKSVYR